MRRRILLCGIALGVLAAAAAWLWPRPRPHLLLITLDTTRADRLGCYRYPAGRTPALDSLAASGVLCERAYTVAPITLPAHASLFTGLYPAENGVRTNGRGKLDAAIPTLAGVLRHQGYHTAAFVASFVLDSKFGLDRGFQVYDDDFVSDDPSADALHRQRNGAAVVDAALAWLKQPRSGPLFCWVHLYDPHFPYLSHPDLFGDEFAERPYDAEIAYVDRQVGRLIDFLKERRLDAQTLVVVVGDHGEGLGDHVERRHGHTLYDSALHVPLIFRRPAQLAPGRRMTANVSLVDVSPTILELLGLADPRTITGKSFRAALQGNSGENGEALCYSATDDPFLSNGWSPLRSLIEGNCKYIRTTKPELYDLAADPGERQNLVEADPDKARTMASRLAELESRLVPRDETRVQLSAAERRALASLGYAGGAAETTEGPPPADLPDVKDMLPFDCAVEDAQTLIHEGSPQAGIERLREITRQARTHSDAHLHLGYALLLRKEFEEAADVYRSLLAVKPENLHGHVGLGLALVGQGRFEEAITEYSQALEIDPGFTDAHYNLAQALAAGGRRDEALAHYTAAIDSDPHYAIAYAGRGRLWADLGRFDEAIGDWRKALKYGPDSAETQRNLGIALAQRGQADEAGRHLARAVEIDPQNSEWQCDLGLFLLLRRQHAQAIAHLNKALEIMPGYARAEAALEQAREALAGQDPTAQ